MGKESPRSTGDTGEVGLIPGSGGSPGGGNGNPLQSGKSHRQRSLVVCSPWGRKESDTTAHACMDINKEHSHQI